MKNILTLFLISLSSFLYAQKVIVVEGNGVYQTTDSVDPNIPNGCSVLNGSGELLFTIDFDKIDPSGITQPVLDSLAQCKMDLLTEISTSQMSVLDSLDQSKLDLLDSIVTSEMTVLDSLTECKLDLLNSISMSEQSVLDSLDQCKLDLLDSIVISEMTVLDSLTECKLDLLDSISVSEQSVLDSLDQCKLDLLDSIVTSEMTVIDSLTQCKLDLLDSISVSEQFVLDSLDQCKLDLLESIMLSQSEVYDSLTQCKVELLDTINNAPLLVFNSGTTGNVSDDSNGSVTVTRRDTIHHWSPSGNIIVTSSPGSVKQGYDVDTTKLEIPATQVTAIGPAPITNVQEYLDSLLSRPSTKNIECYYQNSGVNQINLTAGGVALADANLSWTPQAEGYGRLIVTTNEVNQPPQLNQPITVTITRDGQPFHTITRNNPGGGFWDIDFGNIEWWFGSSYNFVFTSPIPLLIEYTTLSTQANPVVFDVEPAPGALPRLKIEIVENPPIYVRTDTNGSVTACDDDGNEIAVPTDLSTGYIPCMDRLSEDQVDQITSLIEDNLPKHSNAGYGTCGETIPTLSNPASNGSPVNVNMYEFTPHADGAYRFIYSAESIVGGATPSIGMSIGTCLLYTSPSPRDS